MTPKQRAITALNRGIPDQVPTFELEFQLEKEMFGKPFLTEEYQMKNLRMLGSNEREKKIKEYTEYYFQVHDSLDYCIIPAYGMGWFEDNRMPEEKTIFTKYLKQLAGENRMLGHHGDGTFAIPDGNDMYGFAYAIADDPEGVKERAERYAQEAIERNKQLQECGVETLLLCSDYCYNSGPFVSPDMFAEFIQPYLYKIIDAARRDGLYVIKHTDGNIMPILDQLVECKPHALHSIDPMAGVDIREVKRLVGDKVALCGNVHCAAMQTGTEQEVRESAEYCLTYGKEGGGYIFCTSNVPFRGMPPERYKLILDIWKSMRDY